LLQLGIRYADCFFGEGPDTKLKLAKLIKPRAGNPGRDSPKQMEMEMENEEEGEGRSGS